MHSQGTLQTMLGPATETARPRSILNVPQQSPTPRPAATMSCAGGALEPDGALLVPRLICTARPFGTAPLKMLKVLIQGLPNKLLFKPNFTVGWKRFGCIKCCSSHINRIRTFVVLIRQWRPTFSTKCPHYGR
jgi:hypothetical protein